MAPKSLKRIFAFITMPILIVGLLIGIAFASENYSSLPADTNNNLLFDGGELTMFASQTEGQMMSFGIKTKAGNLIMIDGGRRADAAHLAEYIKENGGRVEAWFLTHAHDDHSGALAEMIDNTDLDVEIDRIYYAFPPENLVEYFEIQHYSHIVDINQALEKVETERKYLLLTPGEEFYIDEVVIKVLNDGKVYYTEDTLNNSSLVFQIEMNGRKMMFLGDLGVNASRQLLRDYEAGDLKSDIVQMSHHGQAHIEYELYEKINPDICLWPTPLWLWNNDNGGGKGSGDWSTLVTRQWMEDLGVTMHYLGAEEDVTLR